MNMIEKVANAIRDSFNSNDIDCYSLAKAAIEAMKEPTKEMVQIGGSTMDNCMDENYSSDDDGNTHSYINMKSGSQTTIYQAMIYAALNGE